MYCCTPQPHPDLLPLHPRYQLVRAVFDCASSTFSSSSLSPSTHDRVEDEPCLLTRYSRGLGSCHCPFPSLLLPPLPLLLLRFLCFLHLLSNIRFQFIGGRIQESHSLSTLFRTPHTSLLYSVGCFECPRQLLRQTHGSDVLSMTQS